jgi:hypothetical protein
MEGEEQEEDHRKREERKGMLMRCLPRPMTTVEPGSYARPYTVYGGEAKRVQASE